MSASRLDTAIMLRDTFTKNKTKENFLAFCNYLYKNAQTHEELLLMSAQPAAIPGDYQSQAAKASRTLLTLLHEDRIKGLGLSDDENDMVKNIREAVSVASKRLSDNKLIVEDRTMTKDGVMYQYIISSIEPDENKVFYQYPLAKKNIECSQIFSPEEQITFIRSEAARRRDALERRKTEELTASQKDDSEFLNNFSSKHNLSVVEEINGKLDYLKKEITAFESILKSNSVESIDNNILSSVKKIIDAKIEEIALLFEKTKGLTGFFRSSTIADDNLRLTDSKEKFKAYSREYSERYNDAKTLFDELNRKYNQLLQKASATNSPDQAHNDGPTPAENIDDILRLCEEVLSVSNSFAQPQSPSQLLSRPPQGEEWSSEEDNETESNEESAENDLQPVSQSSSGEMSTLKKTLIIIGVSLLAMAVVAGIGIAITLAAPFLLPSLPFVAAVAAAVGGGAMATTFTVAGLISVASAIVGGISALITGLVVNKKPSPAPLALDNSPIPADESRDESGRQTSKKTASQQTPNLNIPFRANSSSGSASTYGSPNGSHRGPGFFRSTADSSQSGSGFFSPSAGSSQTSRKNLKI